MTRNYQARAERHRDNKLKGKEERSMKRDEVKRIFPDATEEQVNQLLDINSADIGKAREVWFCIENPAQHLAEQGIFIGYR